jgi:hypothetical protein
VRYQPETSSAVCDPPVPATAKHNPIQNSKPIQRISPSLLFEGDFAWKAPTLLFCLDAARFRRLEQKRAGRNEIVAKAHLTENAAGE